MSTSEPTYVTVADHAFFLGAVGLVNSLRVTGNAGPIIVLDAGLTAEQRAHLAKHCEVRPIPVDQSGTLAFYFKPTLGMLGLHGVLVYLDSDMIVTTSLRSLIAPAEHGQLCVFPDGIVRRRDEWTSLLGLESEPRDQPYANAGFFALDVDAWEPTLRRWWELSDIARKLRSQIAWGEEDHALAENDPLFYHDQDVFNAILMSEVDSERICLLDKRLLGFPGWPVYEAGGRVVDRQALAVVDDGRSLAILHYWDYPKPWWPGARSEVMFEAYVELMARLLTADDVAVRLPPTLVPVWLREDLIGRLVRRGPRRAKHGVKRAVRLLPEPLETWALDGARALLRRGH